MDRITGQHVTVLIHTLKKHFDENPWEKEVSFGIRQRNVDSSEVPFEVIRLLRGRGYKVYRASSGIWWVKNPYSYV